MKSKNRKKVERISVIVPDNPFVAPELKAKSHCLCALDVEKLMDWWPGTPHTPHRNPNKVKAIQRSLEWKRVAHIAAYLLQKEIIDASKKLDKYFQEIYKPKKNEPGREWPPRIARTITPVKSSFPTFSNILIHVNGAKINPVGSTGAGKLVFNSNDPDLCFSVIDGQHRINGAFFAIKLLQEEKPNTKWQIPAEVFLNLDPLNEPPRKQAQIFIDVNFNQKKVDRSLVADLYPTARGRDALDDKERAQDVGRRLMLEVGPLVGMIQIPGIKYGVKDVITLATLASTIENTLPVLKKWPIEGLEAQTEFFAQILTAWLEASGRFERPNEKKRSELDPENVAYQGRVLVSILALVPAILWKLKTKKLSTISNKTQEFLTSWFKKIMEKARLLKKGVFIGKKEFKVRKYLGSGGIALFRDTLWVAMESTRSLKGLKEDKITEKANNVREKINRYLKI